MEWVSILALVFALSTAVLAVILIRHLRVGRRKASNVSMPDLERLLETVQSNASRGDIREVARAASDRLVDFFGCTRILYLRYRRGELRVNFRYNLDSAKPDDLRLHPSDQLTRTLLENPHLHDRTALTFLLESGRIESLQQLNLDYVLPICWDDNLYGVYFLGFDRSPSPTQRALVSALVAQPLAAAYHVRWHRHKLDAAWRRLQHERGRTGNDSQAAARRRRMILTLLRRPEPNRVIPELFETVCTELNLSRAVLVVADRDCNSPCHVHLWRLAEPSIAPAPEDIISADDHPALGTSCQVTKIGAPVSEQLLLNLRRCRLDHLVQFPLSTDRAAILAWSGEVNPAEVDDTLATLEAETRTVVKTADSFSRLQQLSCTDPLTELPNRRYFVRRLAEEVKRARRFGRCLTLVFLDVDYLKLINDRYGHLAGDAVLRHLGHVVTDAIRTIDVLCRYGGDEFCIIMPETDHERCSHFLERLSSTVAQHAFTTGQVAPTITCTISMGAAIFPDHAADPRQLLAAADSALLKSKGAGRNSFRVYSTTA